MSTICKNKKPQREPPSAAFSNIRTALPGHERLWQPNRQQLPARLQKNAMHRVVLFRLYHILAYYSILFPVFFKYYTLFFPKVCSVSYKTKRAFLKQKSSFYDAPPGTRTLGPLIKRSQRATIVNFQNCVNLLFLSLCRKFVFCTFFAPVVPSRIRYLAVPVCKKCAEPKSSP